MNPISISKSAIVLAGGLGTRLKSVVQDIPKPMAPVAGHPFLSYVLKYLHGQGIREVVLSIGYRGEVIQNYFQDQYAGMTLKYAVEETPLGTGGAIRAAMELVFET